MSEIRFSSKEHEKFFYQMLAKCGKHDSYYSSFFYCVGISEDTRNHVDRMFDFKERLIKPEALHEGWQTGGSARLTRLAFNLWNGYVEKGEESLVNRAEPPVCHPSCNASGLIKRSLKSNMRST